MKHLFNIFFATLITLTISLSSLYLEAKADPLGFDVPPQFKTTEDIKSGISQVWYMVNSSFNKGFVLNSATAANVGVYEFYDFQQIKLAGNALLKVSTYNPLRSYLYLTNAERSSVNYLGYSNDPAFAQETLSFSTNWTSIDPNSAQWQYLVMMMNFAPESLTSALITASAELLNPQTAKPADLTNFFDRSGAAAREVFFLQVINKIFDILVARPELQLQPALVNSLNAVYIDSPVVTAERRAAVAQRLAEIWPTLSTNNKIILANGLATGDTRTVSIIAPLITGLLPSLKGADLVSIAPTVKMLILYPGLPHSTLRVNLLNTFLHSIKNDAQIRDTKLLELAMQILDQGNGVVLTKSSHLSCYEGAANAVIRRITTFTGSNPARADSLVYLGKTFGYLLSAATLQEVADILAARRSYLLTSDYSDKTLGELAALIADYDLINDKTLLESVLTKTLTIIKAQFPTKLTKADEWTDLDAVVLAVARLVKNKQALYAKDATPWLGDLWINQIISLYNPKQGAAETAAVYSARLSKVRSVWTRRGLLMIDLNGGFFAGGFNYLTPATYRDVAEDFITVNPRGLDVFYLRTVGAPAAIPGVVFMTWQAVEPDPYAFGKEFYKQAAIATMDSVKARSAFGLFHNFWFQENFGEVSYAIISHAAKLNIKESYGELVTNWFADTGFYLSYGVQSYRYGFPALFNSLLFMALEIVPPELRSATSLRTSFLGADATARHLNGTIFGRWVSGTIRNGQFDFIPYGDCRRKVSFVNYKISKITESGSCTEY